MLTNDKFHLICIRFTTFGANCVLVFTVSCGSILTVHHLNDFLQKYSNIKLDSSTLIGTSLYEIIK
jgi:hypothetical protein